MFVYSVRAGTIKFFGILGLAAALLTALIFMLPITTEISAGAIKENESEINYDKVKTNEDRLAFLKGLGWEAEEAPAEEAEIKIPADFDKIMNSYNEIQKKQGLDLSKYKGKTVTRYTYRITN